MSHPDSNFNLGKMLHREYDAAATKFNNHDSSGKISKRIIGVIGLITLSAVVLTLIMFL